MGFISQRLRRKQTSDRNLQYQVLEADSPAVGSDGSLLERVGISIHDGSVASLLECGSQAPVEVSYTFSTSEDDQEQITLNFYRGNASAAADNTYLGQVRLSGFPLAKAQEPRIRLFLRANGRNLEVAAVDDPTGNPVYLARVRSADSQALH